MKSGRRFENLDADRVGTEFADILDKTGGWPFLEDPLKRSPHVEGDASLVVVERIPESPDGQILRLDRNTTPPGDVLLQFVAEARS